MKKSIFLLTLLCLFLTNVGKSQTITEIVVDSEVHNTLEAAVVAADLAETLAGDGPFTVFAPTDAAFAAVGQETIDALLADPQGALTNVLLNHVVSGVADGSNIFDGLAVGNLLGQNINFTVDGGSISVNGANVTVVGIKADNGVVHVIDAVLIPEPVKNQNEGTVVDIIVNSEDHTTLESLVISAGLADDLGGVGPFTVFAPTDAAFAALPAEVVSALTADPMGALANVLLYHVVSGVADAASLSDGLQFSNLAGENLTVSVSDAGVAINGAMVTVADIHTDNGVVHVIDAVIVPPAPTTVMDVIANSEVHNTLESLIISAGLEDDLRSDGPFTVFAPTDDAIAALPADLVSSLTADPTGALANVLLYHVVSGVAESNMLMNGQQFATLLGSNVTVSITDSGVMINDAMVTVADIKTDNGIVHVINAVLVP
ncbi:MAG: fasciclin domain-containing protein [Bacteroidota bacterium]